VSATRAIGAVNVVEEGDLDLTTGLPGPEPDHLGLDGLEEGLNGDVVIVIVLDAHRYFDAVCARDLLVVLQTILAAPVAVEGATTRWLPQGHPQCSDRQITFHAVADGATSATYSHRCRFSVPVLM
jgi:hypothetical protein